MSIKLLGGKARGVELVAPKTNSIRPTSVMLKRRLFDSYQDFTHVIFIDLCAGTGSIAFEALSRGASEIYCVDKNPKAIELLKKNKIKMLNHSFLADQINIIKSDAVSWLKDNLKQFSGSKQEIYVFYDPPYSDITGYKSIFQQLTESKAPVRLIMEACSQKTLHIMEFEKEFPNPIKIFKQGTSFFMIYDFE